MANRRRGEIAAVVDGEPAVLCLTLGALAELETAFGVGDLVALAERFATGRLSAADLVRVYGAALRGGGRAISDDEVATARVDGGLAAIAAHVGDLLEVTFGAAAGDGADGSRGAGRAAASPPDVPGAASPSPGTR